MIIVVFANPLEEVSKTNVRLTGRIWELDDGFKGCVVLIDAYHWLKVANLTANEAGEKVRTLRAPLDGSTESGTGAEKSYLH